MGPFQRGRAKAAAMVLATLCEALLGLAGLAGCSPALDWREFDPEGSRLHVGFPCRPDRSVRAVPLDVGTAPMTMFACEAAGRSFAVGYVDLDASQHAAPVMRSWRLAAARNLGSADTAAVPHPVAGALANPEAGMLTITEGHLPDGRRVQARFVWFARGNRVYQAGTVDPGSTQHAAETFFEALRAFD